MSVTVNADFGPVLEVLRVSSNNEERKAAAAQLRTMQEQVPEAFLAYTFDFISVADNDATLRFFLCTTILEFVQHTWFNAVTKETQKRYIELYTMLALQQQFPSELLARKVGTVLAVMCKRANDRALPGAALPPLLQGVTDALRSSLESGASRLAFGDPSAAATESQALLITHILLKEMQTKCVGSDFEGVCQTFVASLSAVFNAVHALDPVVHYRLFLFLFKCSYRVFGCGVFVADVYPFLLRTSWQLANGLSSADSADPSARERRMRLFEYSLKLQESVITYFPSQLHQLQPSFFVVTGPSCGSAGDVSLLHLLISVLEVDAAAGATAPHGEGSDVSGMERALSVKAVCRALRIFNGLFTAEDGDEFVAACLNCCAASPLMTRLMRCCIALLADDVSEEAMREWRASPEKLVDQLDMDVDDVNSPASCAEQLFLALTGSTNCAATCLGLAWARVNELLGSGSVQEITAALHAIGIGYYTMADPSDSSSYHAFLHGKLIPILQSSASSQDGSVSPFVLRRVVWLIGMWCESVTSVDDRRAVHSALEAMLREQRDVVIVLTALRSIENFVSDLNFTLGELSSTGLNTILTTVQHVLPHLNLPSTVQKAAGVVHVFIEKGALRSHGAAIIEIFLPATQRYMADFDKCGGGGSSSGNVIHNGDGAQGSYGADGDSADDDDDGVNVGTLGMLIECLGSGVKVCEDVSAVWSLFRTVVLPCTTPGLPVTPWAEDYAWELMLTMARHTPSALTLPPAVVSEVRAATEWCVTNTERDFAVLHLTLRALYTLLLVGDAPSELVVNDRLLQQSIAGMVEAPTPELGAAFGALCAAVAETSSGQHRGTLACACVAALTACDEVQSAPNPILVATILLFSCEFAAKTDAAAAAAFLGAAVATAPNSERFTEQLVLLMDIATSRLSTAYLVRLLRCCLGVPGLVSDPQEFDMIQSAIQGAAALPGGAGSGFGDAVGAEGDDAEEERSPVEMLLELLGDEEVSLNCPHVQRLQSVFPSADAIQQMTS